ncbi:MAG: type II toxin-antitoxin system VapC family toxin [Gaiellaceae bacterium]
MRVVYVDTGALIALIWKRDRAHGRVREHYRRLRAQRDGLLTSNLVLAETATRLRYDAGLPAALAFKEVVEEAVATGALSVRYADPDLDGRAWQLMEQYADRALSFADCVGAVTARDGRADAVFGLDADFSILGFALEP